MNAKRKIPFFPIGFLFKTAYENGGVDLKYIPLFCIYILKYLLLEPFRLAEILIFEKRIKNYQLAHSPLFVLGHWRSGTSHVQNLLRQDPNTTSMSIYSGLFADNYFMTEPWLKKILNLICKIFKVPYSIQRTNMDLDIPAELDAALCSMCSEHSYTWGHLFPRKFESWFNKLILSEDESRLRGWIEDQHFLIRKLAYRSNNKQVIVKSPGDTARIKSLIKKYPGAKFVYVYRDPFFVYHSTSYLWGVIQQQNSLQKITAKETHLLIISSYEKLLKNYLMQRPLIPPSQLIEVNFKAIQQNPLSEMKEIYSKLNLRNVPEKEILTFTSAVRSYRTPDYVTSPELEQELKSKWAFAFEQWGY